MDELDIDEVLPDRRRPRLQGSGEESEEAANNDLVKTRNVWRTLIQRKSTLR
jgi:hypothetical protein